MDTTGNNLTLDDWADIFPGFLRIPIKIYQRRSLFSYCSKMLLTEFNGGATNILLVGRPNVGKSIILSHLNKNYSHHDWVKPNISANVEHSVIRHGNTASIIRCLPGQDSQAKLVGWSKSFSNKSLNGIVYVADFGYTDYRNVTIKRKAESEQPTIEQHRQKILDDECTDFKRVCDRVKEAVANNGGPKWMIVVVNKADLFKDNLAMVQDYYERESKFKTITDEFRNDIGALNFQIRVLPLCSHIEDFEWNKEVKKGDIGGSSNQKSLMNYFVSQIISLST